MNTLILRQISLIGALIGGIFTAETWSAMGSSSSSRSSSGSSSTSSLSLSNTLGSIMEQFHGSPLEKEPFKGIIKNSKPSSLAVPAPSLMRWQRVSSESFKKMLGSAGMQGKVPSLVATSEEGDLFFCDPDISPTRIISYTPHGEKEGSQRSIGCIEESLKSTPTVVCRIIDEYYKSRLEVIELQDNWSLLPSIRDAYGDLVNYWNEWKNFSYIPVIRSVSTKIHEEAEQGQELEIEGEGQAKNKRLFELGVLDVNTRSITSIALIGKNDRVFAANSRAALIRREMLDAGNHAVYLVGNKNCIYLGPWYLGRSWQCYHYDLDSECGRALVYRDGGFCIMDVNNHEGCLVVPNIEGLAGVCKPFLNNVNNNIFNLFYKTESDYRCAFYYKSLQYDKALDRWSVNHKLPTPSSFMSRVIANEQNIIVTGLLAPRLRGHFKVRPYIMALGSGKLAEDLTLFERQGQKMIVTSRSGKYIATQLHNSDILTWKVRGIDLPGACTFEDRRDLHELDVMYRIGQERNEKHDRNYVVRLNPRQWTKFQELSQRPECEVPHDWARLFRPLTTFQAMRALHRNFIINVVRPMMAQPVTQQAMVSVSKSDKSKQDTETELPSVPK